MRLLRLAWRNVFRHRRRTLITFAAIAFGLGYMILMDSFMGGFEVYSMRNFVDQEAGHLKIHAAGYRDEENAMPVDVVIEQPGAVMRRLEDELGFGRAAPRTWFRGELGNGVDQLPVVGIGIDTATDGRVFDYPAAVSRGRFFRDRLELLVGQNLAHDLGVDTGDYVTVLARTRAGSWNALDFTVVGLLGTADMFIDMSAVVMPLGTADDLLGMDGAVTEIAVRLDGMAAAAPAKKRFEQAGFEALEAWTWRELGELVFQITGTKRAAGFILIMVVIVIAAVGIVNTMLMAVMERTREIGTLRALGFGSRQVVTLFLWEGGLIGFFGSLAGVVIGVGASVLLDLLAIDLTGLMMGFEQILPMRMILYTEVDPLFVLQVALLGIGISLLATLLPARRAARVQPAEALRHV
ncbi:ABC transporter permease [candidate division WOR-3 bacterium]|nr:ABC transporter permease [candidate division WOR-3 bacterium]